MTKRKSLRAAPGMALLLMALLLMAACASIGNPSGGPRDEAPPRFVRSNPAPGALNVSRERVDIEFDEIVNVKDAFTNVVVSPVSKSTPRVTSQGRRVSVVFPDSLLPNTTYTIDFGNSIEDNNEANRLEGFALSFSTGPRIDSLKVSGVVLGAKDLEPRPGMVVGVYSNLADSAFSTLVPDRVARTDDRGRFSVRGLAPGEYRVYALGDTDNDWHHANPEEEMAFLDFTVSPATRGEEVADTVYNLRTGAVDSVMRRLRTRYIPDDLLLRSFVADKRPQYLVKYERIDSTRVSLVFNSPLRTPPSLEFVGHAPNPLMVAERNAACDTIVYWLRDPALVAADTLHLALGYERPDSTGRLVAGTDTLRLVTQRQRAVKKNKKKVSEADSIAAVMERVTLPLRVLTQATHEVYNPLLLEFGTPLARLDSAAFHLDMKVDSIWHAVGGAWRVAPVDTLNPRLFKIEYPWAFDTNYRLTADTLAAGGIYGTVSMPLSHEFKTRSESDYSRLTFNITGFSDTVPAFVELLNSSDNAMRTAPVDEYGHADFRFLAPGKYYARIYEDFNGNGLYDTGDFDSLRQPDQAYYYPKTINIKKNWEKSETWDVFATAVDLQKPDAVKKNKPEADKRRRGKQNQQQEEEEDDDDFFDPTRNPFDPNDRRDSRR